MGTEFEHRRCEVRGQEHEKNEVLRGADGECDGSERDCRPGRSVSTEGAKNRSSSTRRVWSASEASLSTDRCERSEHEKLEEFRGGSIPPPLSPRYTFRLHCCRQFCSCNPHSKTFGLLKLRTSRPSHPPPNPAQRYMWSHAWSDAGSPGPVRVSSMR